MGNTTVICHKLSAKQSAVFILWLRLAKSQYSQLPVAVVREICLYIRDNPLLISAHQRSIHYLDYSDRQWKPLVMIAADLDFDNDNSYCVINNSRLFCYCRPRTSYSAKRIAKFRLPKWLTHKPPSIPLPYLVDLSTGEAKQLRTTSYRNSPGLYHFEGNVYLFSGLLQPFSEDGGISYFAENEAMSVASLESTQLPAMQSPRWGASVCEWSRRLYVCLGCLCDSIEVFSVDSRCFLPELTVHYGYLTACVAWVESDSLVLLHYSKSTRTQLRDGSVTDVKCTLRHDLNPVCCASVVQGRAYWVELRFAGVARIEAEVATVDTFPLPPNTSKR